MDTGRRRPSLPANRELVSQHLVYVTAGEVTAIVARAVDRVDDACQGRRVARARSVSCAPRVSTRPSSPGETSGHIEMITNVRTPRFGLVKALMHSYHTSVASAVGTGECQEATRGLGGVAAVIQGG